MNILKPPLIAVACAAALLSAPTLGEQVGPKQPQLECKTGPLTKVYGGTTWLLYSCDDNRSIVIVSAPGSPAAPFYFSYFPEAGGYHLSGEGTGDRAATDLAYKELVALTAKDIALLIADTKRH
ncbi:MAG TPA: hypothetical protein VG889_18145 [Rhizomicrobium sp.]|nr:hypothetical protein [Rhizomicrobium sp.]